MTQITIDFSNVSLSSSNSAIALSGAAFALDVNDGFNISGTVSFSSMYVTTGAISFNVTAGTAFNATVQATVISNTPGTSPAIDVTNFMGGSVTVTWPTATGPERQILEPGNLLTLNGYIG